MTDRDPLTIAREVLEREERLSTYSYSIPVEAQASWDATRSEQVKAAPDLARAVIDLTAKLESGEASDGHHTHNELYEYRTLYHAHAALAWAWYGVEVTKSWRHADGELCFGGGWFIVTAQLPTGQVSNHYPEQDWHLFDVPEVERPAEWDGHTPQEAARRLRTALNGDNT